MEINKIKPGINRVLVKISKDCDTILLKNGTKLQLDTTYNPEQHVAVSGEIIAPPVRLHYDKKDSSGMDWKTKIEVKSGDKVYFSYHAALMALGTRADPGQEYCDPLWIDQDDKLYIFIKYEDLYIVIRDRKEIPLNGYVIVERVKDCYSGTLKVESKFSDKSAIVRTVGSINQEYRTEEIDAIDISHGDLIFYKPDHILRIEDDLHKTLNINTFIVQRRYILARLKRRK